MRQAISHPFQSSSPPEAPALGIPLPQHWRGSIVGRLVLGGVVLLAMLRPVAAQVDAPADAPQTQPADPEGIETLTQGPIHEAFANPAELDPTPGPVVKRQPPPDVKEDPPEFMPEGAIWITGYWIWDDERDNFVWLTGVARQPPPGMRYVPGYWTQAEGGWQRVSGFWVSADAGEIAYREPPPNSLEAGPSSPAPADNYFWIPGSWNYYDTGYRWRGGYWSPYQANWIWVPARWVWTPGGCIYLPGYWDHRLAFRGQIFAPVYFTTALYTQPGWFYRPWCVIPTNNLFIHLWIRPNYCHYYFGNYYAAQYANFGFFSWSTFPSQRYFYDPFFTYCSVHYKRQGIDFIGRVQGWHNYYAEHADHRPPRTWREQQQLAVQVGAKPALETQLVAHNIVEVAKQKDAPLRLTKLDEQSRKAIVQKTEKLQELNTARKKIEHDAALTLTKLPSVDDAARKGAEAARDAAKGRDAGGKADEGKVARGKADERDKRGKLIEQAEGTKKAAQETQKGVATGPTAKLTLPKDADATVRSKAGKGLPGGDQRGAISREIVPPPMPEGAIGGRQLENQLEIRGQRTTRGQDREGTESRGSDRSGKTTLPSTNTPRIDLPQDAGKGKATKGESEKGKLPRDAPGKGKSGKDESPSKSQKGDSPRDGGSKGKSQKDDSPRDGAPKGKGPKSETSKLGGPGFDVPQIERPRSDARRIEVPGAETPRITPRSMSPRDTGSRIELPGTGEPRTSPKVVEPRSRERASGPGESPGRGVRIETPRVDTPSAGGPKSSSRVERSGDQRDTAGKGKARDRDDDK